MSEATKASFLRGIVWTILLQSIMRCSFQNVQQDKLQGEQLVKIISFKAGIDLYANHV